MAIAATLVGTRTAINSTSITTGSGTSSASGSTFVVCASYDPLSTLDTVTDSKSNTYTQIGSVVSGRGQLSMWYSANATGGASHTASVAFFGDPYAVVYLIEITGASTTPLDVAASGTASVEPYTLATGTLAQANEIIIAMCEWNWNGPTTTYSSSNMTIIDQESDSFSWWSSCVAKLVVSSTSSVAPSFTTNFGDDTAGLKLATFKEAGSATYALLLRGT
jgi:hypothetical protein